MNRDPSVAAAMLQDEEKVDTPARTAPEGDDASMSGKSRMRRKSLDKGVRADRLSGLAGDESPDGLKQDTPGRPKSASSRQQTKPRQIVQSGNDEKDQDPGSQ